MNNELNEILVTVPLSLLRRAWLRALTEILEGEPAKATNPTYVTAAVAAELLGVSERQIRRLAQQGRIQVTTIGRSTPATRGRRAQRYALAPLLRFVLSRTEDTLLTQARTPSQAETQ